MQLFILDRSPELSALALSDIHLRKMCLETAQILSAVIRIQNRPLTPDMPEVYNINHPVIKALDSQFRINWTTVYFQTLHKEYFRRFRKYHAYASLAQIYRQILFRQTDIEDWNFAKVFKDFTPVSADIVSAYREYYRFKKSIIKNWYYTNADEPEWLK